MGRGPSRSQGEIRYMKIVYGYMGMLWGDMAITKGYIPII